MKTRMKLHELEPNAYQAMFGLEKYLNSISLDKTLKELIKIRASQINRCAYCIEMHTKAALENGESNRRIFALSAWTESPLFSDKERALLQMTEEITNISNNGLTDATFQQAKEYFSENEIAQIIMQISIINTWNRMAVSTQIYHED